MKRFFDVVLLGLSALALPALATQAPVQVAVAANFSAPMRRIAAAFEAETGVRAALSFGATGSFYAQISNGAPFELLLAADEETPARLEREGLALAGTRFTYAIGRLVLWSAQPRMVDDHGAVLREAATTRIAVAEPKLAPYGAAAFEALARLGLLQSLLPRLVRAGNVAQAYQFVATGNAPLGFVALSQLMVDGRIGAGSGWVVPAQLHKPIRQDAVLLARGRDNAGAASLAAYLKSDKARAIIRAYGYEF